MVEGKDTEKMNTGTFLTSDENAKDERDEFRGYRVRGSSPEPERIEKVRSMRVSTFQKTADRFWRNKLIRNTAICAVAALIIWGIASSGTPAGQQAAGAIRGVIDYQTNLEKDLGDLKFVDSILGEDAAMALAKESPAASAVNGQDVKPANAAPSAASVKNPETYPLDGTLTTTFEQSKSGVIITATDSTDVKSIKAGKVSRVSENYLVVQNGDSSVTSYYGVKASVKKDDSVQAGQQIGKLLSQTLYVEETLNGKKTDPLS